MYLDIISFRGQKIGLLLMNVLYADYFVIRLRTCDEGVWSNLVRERCHTLDCTVEEDRSVDNRIERSIIQLWIKVSVMSDPFSLHIDLCIQEW